MRGATKKDTERAVKEFNRESPIGTQVRFWPGTREGQGKVSKTSSVASVLGGHTPVVWVEDYAGCIALTHVEAL